MKRSGWWVLGFGVLAAITVWALSKVYVGPPAPRPVAESSLDPEIRALAQQHADRVDARRGDPQRRYELGLVYQANELYELATQCFLQAAAQRPKEPATWFYLAHCRERLGDLEGAVRAMERTAALTEGYAPVHWRLAMWRADLGDSAGAQSAARDALGINPEAAPAHLVLASLAVSEEALDHAAEIIAEQRLGEGPGAPWAHRILLEIAQRRGDEEAVARHKGRAGDRGAFYALDPWLGTLTQYRTGLAYRSRRAGRLVRAGRYEEAIPLLLTLVEEEPEDPRTLNLLASCYLRTQRREDALELLQRSAAAAPEHLGTFINLTTALLATRAPTATELGDAEAAALRALELDAESAPAHFALGEVRRVQGRREEAFAAYQQAFVFDSRSTKALFRAGSLLLDQEEWTEALTLYGTAVEREPQRAEGHVGRAIALVGLKRLEEAAEALARAEKAEIPAYRLFQLAQARLTKAQSTVEISKR